MKSTRINSGLQALSLAERRNTILQNLGLLNRHGTRQATAITETTLLSEVLRVSLWALSNTDDPTQMQPVHVTRLLNSAKSLVEPTQVRHFMEDNQSTDRDWNEFIPLALRRLMDELEDIGDIARLPRGFWLPSPFRFIPVPSIRRWILTGGIPTRLLSSSVREACEFSGAARLLNEVPLKLGLPPLTQTREDWCHIPPEPTDNWAKKILQGAEMQPFEAVDTHYEFYAPGILRSTQGELQYFRWTDNLAALPDNRYLMRYRSSFGPVYHSVTEVRNRTIFGTASLDSLEGSIRRLQYGMDKLSGIPVTIKVEHLKDGEFSYTLKNELPAAENRLFLTLGRLQENADGSYYPRMWLISKDYAAEADRALRHLGVGIVRV